MSIQLTDESIEDARLLIVGPRDRERVLEETACARIVAGIEEVRCRSLGATDRSSRCFDGRQLPRELR